MPVPDFIREEWVRLAMLAGALAALMLGESLTPWLHLDARETDHIAVKEAVFPFARFPGVDTLLGPEMRSTGEVMGIADSFGMAFAKAQISADGALPLEGSVFITVNDSDKNAVVPIARRPRRNCVIGPSHVSASGVQGSSPPATTGNDR